MDELDKISRNMNNTGIMHKSCSLERKQLWQDQNLNTNIEIGGFCKLPFTDGEKKDIEGGTSVTVEHMWVEVKEVNGRKYGGVLNNDPVFVDIECGDSVTFEHEDIEDYLDK